MNYKLLNIQINKFIAASAVVKACGREFLFFSTASNKNRILLQNTLAKILSSLPVKLVSTASAVGIFL